MRAAATRTDRRSGGRLGLAIEVGAGLCVAVMFLAGHDVWNDTGRIDFWRQAGPPFADIRVFVGAYYLLAVLTIGRLVSRACRRSNCGTERTAKP